MTTTSFSDNVEITGSRDVTQLEVAGTSSQTQPLQTWEDNASDVLAQMTADGRFQLGDDLGFASPDALIAAHRADTSTAKPKRGFHSLGRISDALSSIAQWIVQELEIHGTDNLSALQTALRVSASNMNTGTPASGAEVRAADFEVINDAEAGSDALPVATGLQVAVTNASGKTITQAVGLHVKMNNSGTITSPYAIYTEGAGIIHLDDIQELIVVSDTPTSPPPEGYILLYPKLNGGTLQLYAMDSSGAEQVLGPGSAIDDTPIGANTPSTGAFTTLTATSDTIVEGDLTVHRTSDDAFLCVDANAGQQRKVAFRTNYDQRFAVYVDESPETGSNAGSDFVISRFSDAGAYLGDALSIERATGNVVVDNALYVDGDFIHRGSNVGFYNSTPVAQPSYGAATGTATRTTFDTSTVTLSALAERVKAMIDDLQSVGLFAD